MSDMAISTDFLSFGLLITVISGVIIAEVIKSVIIHFTRKGTKKASRYSGNINLAIKDITNLLILKGMERKKLNIR